MIELGEHIEGIIQDGRLSETTTHKFISKKDKESMMEVAKADVLVTPYVD